MDVTSRFVLDFAQKFARRHPGARILDFGCGAGALVDAGLARALPISGADVFYGGAEAGPRGGAIHEIHGGVLPFADASFGLVVNNQVMEHVEDLDSVLREIHRVLSPGGRVLSIFPSRDVFREGHIGIPFSHWFHPGSRARFYYTWALRAIGLGTWKDQAPTARQWALDKLRWIDLYTRYRTAARSSPLTPVTLRARRANSTTSVTGWPIVPGAPGLPHHWAFLRRPGRHGCVPQAGLPRHPFAKGRGMRIAYVITRADAVGGATIHVRDLAGAMRARGHEALVLVGGEGPVTAQFAAAGVTFLSLRHLRRSIHPVRDILAFRELTGALRAFAPDLLSVHTAKAGWLGRAAAARLGLPVVYTPDGLPVSGRFSGVASRRVRVAERVATRWNYPLICVSGAERRWL